MLMNADNVSLLIVDVQERLLPVMDNPKAVINNTEVLIQAAHLLSIPVRVSEQYPKGLGETVLSLHSYLTQVHATTYEKIDFSCYREKEIRDALSSDSDRRQLVICGIEAHVCVMQTAIEFKENGYEVFVVSDAISSRDPISVKEAKRRLEQEGISLVTTEMAVFEWLGQAGTEIFKDVSKLIK